MSQRQKNELFMNLVGKEWSFQQESEENWTAEPKAKAFRVGFTRRFKPGVSISYFK